MSLLETRSYYKPFEYPWMYDLYKKSEAMHWLPEEVEFRDDIRDWNENLSDSEINLLTQLFRFFTQADIDVAGGYNKVYLPNLGNSPEALMMMGSFANRENVHIDAYSTLIETLGMDDDIYKAFAEYEVMKDKHEYVQGFSGDNPYELLKSLAVYSGFTEGMQLFSSFAILMNFERHNKMKGMSNIVRWSIKDESLHVEGMTRLFRTLREELQENSQGVNEDYRYGAKIEEEVADIAVEMVLLEDKFIDLCFEQGGIENLEAKDVKNYIRYIANTRWTQLGFTGVIYKGKAVEENPLEWLDWVINGVEHANMFEARPTEYSKGTLVGTIGDDEW